MKKAKWHSRQIGRAGDKVTVIFKDGGWVTIKAKRRSKIYRVNFQPSASPSPHTTTDPLNWYRIRRRVRSLVAGCFATVWSVSIRAENGIDSISDIS